MNDQREDHAALDTRIAERDYLLRRAEDHRRLAERSREAGSDVIHLRFQRLYEERAMMIGLVVPD